MHWQHLTRAFYAGHTVYRSGYLGDWGHNKGQIRLSNKIMLMSLSIYLKNEKKHLNRSQFMSFLCSLLGATEKKILKKREKNKQTQQQEHLEKERDLFTSL